MELGVQWGRADMIEELLQQEGYLLVFFPIFFSPPSK